jgi:hypothetical protein
MTSSQVVALLLGSAVISGIVGALINGVFNTYLKRWELRESRLKIASELTRLNQERYIEAYRNSPGADVGLQDPATVLRFYLAELDKIAGGHGGIGATK